jgi:hypothetical protein
VPLPLEDSYTTITTVLFFRDDALGVDRDDLGFGERLGAVYDAVGV